MNCLQMHKKQLGFNFVISCLHSTVTPMKKGDILSLVLVMLTITVLNTVKIQWIKVLPDVVHGHFH